MKFVNRFEARAQANGSYRNQIGRYELTFLEQVWGPAFRYNFDGLEPEYPFRDFKGGDRFADFVFQKNGIRLVFEIDGFTTHARDISPGDFNDHLTRQNDLVLQGWMILRFSSQQVEKYPMMCQRQVLQALGHWWTHMNRHTTPKETDIWSYRKQLLAEFAFSYGGFFRVAELSRHFSIPLRTARDWISRFVVDGTLIPIQPNKKIIGYQLSGYSSSG